MNRVEQILKSIVKDKSLVKWHNNWGYYIQVPFAEINMIGLIDKSNHYELTLYFGDTQSQSRAFYATNPKIERLSKDLSVHGNFHFSSAFGKGLIWFESDINPKDYINFWRGNTQLLHRHNVSDARKLITQLKKDGVIKLSSNKTNELNNNIYHKNYSVLNINAGLGIIYKIPKTKIENGSLSELRKLLITKINEGLSIIDKDANKFLNEGDPIGL
ncbi:hypothetical protein AMR72_02255 [Flavobacterium psychrophilum]|nr:hypothetical protein AMR72_02255 [Flavobacterium psychrophilum]AOE51448.1 hypothetical protein ALW18_02255 [Flavobacterium psychrophilum]